MQSMQMHMQNAPAQDHITCSITLQNIILKQSNADSISSGFFFFGKKISDLLYAQCSFLNA